MALIDIGTPSDFGSCGIPYHQHDDEKWHL